MAIRTTQLGGTDWSGEKLIYPDLNDTFDASSNGSLLGEVKMFALSMTGAITKSNLQVRGWAICDGTTPATQGITSPTIETTPDLQEKFLRMSNDETSGGTGGSDTHTLTVAEIPSHKHTIPGTWDSNTWSSGTGAGYKSDATTTDTSNTGSGDAHNNIPAYYEVAYFIKVKVI